MEEGHPAVLLILFRKRICKRTWRRRVSGRRRNGKQKHMLTYYAERASMRILELDTVAWVTVPWVRILPSPFLSQGRVLRAIWRFVPQALQARALLDDREDRPGLLSQSLSAAMNYSSFLKVMQSDSHSCATYSQHQREKFVRERHLVASQPVVRHEEPSPNVPQEWQCHSRKRRWPFDS